jgi:hypothetical protein
LKPIKATVVKSAFISRGAKSNRLIFIWPNPRLCGVLF